MLESCVLVPFDTSYQALRLLGSRKTWGSIDFFDQVDGVDGVPQNAEESKLSLIFDFVIMESFNICLY